MWEPIWGRSEDTHPMGNPLAFQLAAAYLDEPNIVTVEDWGCGCGHFQPFLSHRQDWIGVDGCKDSAALVIADLIYYRSNPDAIHMRGVLEHNDSWPAILGNFLASFKHLGVLTIFLSWVEHTIRRKEGRFIVYSYKREDIIERLENVKLIHEIPVQKTHGNETVLCLRKN